MADNRVSIIITARDMASDALRRLGESLDNAGEESRRFQRNISDINGTMSSAMSTVMKFAGIIAGGLSFGAAISSAYSQILDSETGTGKKPLVLYSSVFRVRSGSEGIPVIVLNGSFRTLASTETLLI